MDLKELKELIRLVSEKGITEFELEREGIRLRICRAADSAPAAPLTAYTAPVAFAAAPETPAPAALLPAAAPASAAAAPPAVAPKESLHILKSPIVGTFYRSPSPSSPPFVSVGDRVEQDTVVCIIEAMKLMNEIQAEVIGEIVEIYPENAQPVEYGQPLFGIRTN